MRYEWKLFLYWNSGWWGVGRTIPLMVQFSIDDPWTDIGGEG